MPPKSQRDLSGYQYSALSSLVLNTGRGPRGENEPTGEAESLVGRIDPKAMGSRVARQPIADLEKKKRKAAENDELGAARKVRAGATNQYADVLQASADLEGLRYRPRTDETRAVYELILSIAHGALGDQASDVVRSATDTVIEVLKDDSMKDLDKKREAEGVLGPLSEETFTQLVNLGKRITDYTDAEPQGAGEGTEGAGVDDETGVAVLFDNDEESDPEEETYVVRDEDDEEEDEEDGERTEQTPGDGDADTAPPSEDLVIGQSKACLLYTSPSPRDKRQSRMPSSA